MSLDRLITAIAAKQNPTVAGLDPKLEYVPDFIKCKAFEKHGETLKGAAKAILEYNKGLIDALCGIVPAVKPQAAYYEMYGYQRSELVKLDILVNKEEVDALSFIVHGATAYERGRKMCEKLKEEIPRQLQYICLYLIHIAGAYLLK